MNIVIKIPINIKDKYQFIRYLLKRRIYSTCSYLKARANPKCNIKITHTNYISIQNRKYNTNIGAVDKKQ